MRIRNGMSSSEAKEKKSQTIFLIVSISSFFPLASRQIHEAKSRIYSDQDVMRCSTARSHIVFFIYLQLIGARPHLFTIIIQTWQNFAVYNLIKNSCNVSARASERVDAKRQLYPTINKTEPRRFNFIFSRSIHILGLNGIYDRHSRTRIAFGTCSSAYCVRCVSKAHRIHSLYSLYSFAFCIFHFVIFVSSPQ